MAKKPLPSPETLRQLLRYEPDTGKLFWLPRPVEMFAPGNTSSGVNCRLWNNRYAGSDAFSCVDRRGYLFGNLKPWLFRAHRVAWAINYGLWPVGEIDHINGDKLDNRIKNLREATKSENGRNRPLDVSNKSGFKGVSWHKQRQKWRANIVVHGAQHSLGLHLTREDAHAAYCEAAQRLHGEFARTE